MAETAENVTEKKADAEKKVRKSPRVVKSPDAADDTQKTRKKLNRTNTKKTFTKKEPQPKIPPISDKEFMALCQSEDVEDMRKAVHYVVNRAANPHVKEDTGNTALMWATGQGHTPLVRALIRAGAELNLQDDSGFTALYWSARSGFVNATVAMIEAGADIEIPSNVGMTPLMAASRAPSPMCVEALLKAGAKVDKVDDEGRTAFMYASRRGMLENMKLLMQYGATAEGRGNDGDTALVYAAVSGDPRVAKYLVEELGVDINAQGVDGETAVLRAAKRNKRKFMLALIRLGADTTIKDNSGKAVRDYLDIDTLLAKIEWDKNVKVERQRLKALGEAPEKIAEIIKEKFPRPQPKNAEEPGPEAAVTPVVKKVKVVKKIVKVVKKKKA